MRTGFWLAFALPSPLSSTSCSRVVSVPTRLGLRKPLAGLAFLSLHPGSAPSLCQGPVISVSDINIRLKEVKKEENTDPYSS